MLDARFIRENPDIVKKAIKDRGTEADVDSWLELDARRRKLLTESESLRHEQKVASEERGKLRKEKKAADEEIAKMKKASQKLGSFEGQVEELSETLAGIALLIPNIPHKTVPAGAGSQDNQEIRSWGQKPPFDFEPVPHWDLASTLGLIDFKRASKLSGSGFALYTGEGARLERALISFMLDLHTKEHGCREILPPFIVSRECMVGTGQVPKQEEDMYHCEVDDLFLIPTAEVPVTNLHRDEILAAEDLPLYYTSYTACFRREAGSYGKDTKGLLRVHQFDKVELVKFVKPETSYDELESLLLNAEEVLQRLGLHYRVVALCTGDMSFSASKCYDIEVWAPAQGSYLEVSSCSNFEDFQARRARIRYRPGKGESPRFVHTLNGSGIALPRAVVALLETYQEKDGTVVIPEALRPYMDGKDRLTGEGN